jgi:hypothetical protein
MKRVVLAALAGGLVMFLSESVIHMMTPLGEAGLQNLPNEEAVLTALRSNLSAPGFYFFPGMDERAKTPEGHKEWEQRYTAGPSGLLLYHPQGGQPFTARMLLLELLTDILAVFVAAWVATHGATYGRRVAIVAAFGFASWFSIEVSYWNWYGFPTAYTLAQLVDQVASFAVAGLVVAKIVRPGAAAAPG